MRGKIIKLFWRRLLLSSFNWWHIITNVGIFCLNTWSLNLSQYFLKRSLRGAGIRITKSSWWKCSTASESGVRGTSAHFYRHLQGALYRTEVWDLRSNPQHLFEVLEYLYKSLREERRIHRISFQINKIRIDRSPFKVITMWPLSGLVLVSRWLLRIRSKLYMEFLLRILFIYAPMFSYYDVLVFMTVILWWHTVSQT